MMDSFWISLDEIVEPDPCHAGPGSCELFYRGSGQLSWACKISRAFIFPPDVTFEFFPDAAYGTIS